jgi:hypothetical protein
VVRFVIIVVLGMMSFVMACVMRTVAQTAVIRVVVGIDVVPYVVGAVFGVMTGVMTFVTFAVVVFGMVPFVVVGIGFLGLRLGSKKPSLHGRFAVGGHEGNFPQADFLPIDRGHSRRAATA